MGSPTVNDHSGAAKRSLITRRASLMEGSAFGSKVAVISPSAENIERLALQDRAIEKPRVAVDFLKRRSHDLEDTPVRTVDKAECSSGFDGQ